MAVVRCSGALACRIALLSLALPIVWLSPAQAQRKADTVAVGDRVRMALPGETGRLQAVVDSIEDGALWLRLSADAPPRQVLLATMARLEVRRTGRRTVAGALIGAALVGGWTAWRATSDPWMDAYVMEATLVGMLPGAFVGAVVGSFFRGEVWKRVSPDWIRRTRHVADSRPPG